MGDGLISRGLLIGLNHRRGLHRGDRNGVAIYAFVTEAVTRGSANGRAKQGALRAANKFFAGKSSNGPAKRAADNFVACFAFQAIIIDPRISCHRCSSRHSPLRCCGLGKGRDTRALIYDG